MGVVKFKPFSFCCLPPLPIPPALYLCPHTSPLLEAMEQVVTDSEARFWAESGSSFPECDPVQIHFSVPPIPKMGLIRVVLS